MMPSPPHPGSNAPALTHSAPPLSWTDARDGWSDLLKPAPGTASALSPGSAIKGPGLFQFVSAVAAVMAGYYLATLVGMALRLPASTTAVIWPASAVLLAAILAAPTRQWWFIAAVIPVHYATLHTFGLPPWRILGHIAGNSLLVVVAAGLLRWLDAGPPFFENLRRCITFIAVGVILPCLIGLLSPTFVLSVYHPASTGPDWSYWMRSALSNITGFLLVVPVIVLWHDRGDGWWRHLSGRRLAEASLLAGSLVIVGLLVLADWEGDHLDSASVFLPLPLLLWATMRFGPTGASTALLTVVALSLTGAMRGAGPFSDASSSVNVLSLQLYWIALFFSLLPLAVVMQERWRDREQLQQNAKRLHLALEAGRMGIWEWDPRTRDLQWSAEHFTIMGFSPFSVKPDYATWARSLHPDDLPAAEQAMQDAITERRHYRQEYRLRLPDGTIRWVESWGRAVFDETGTCAKLVGLIVDITGRKRVDEELTQSEQRYREVVETQTDMVCRYRPDTTLTFVNGAYCRFFNRTREQLLGRRFIELVPEVAREGVLAHVAVLVQTRALQSYEHEVSLADGSIRWQQWMDYALLEPDGSVREFQGIGRDITDRKHAEEAQRNLAHASRLAMAGELTASIAHEINQPLGAILSNIDAAEMLMEQPGCRLETIREILSDIRKDDLRASDIIHHLRSLLRKRELEFQSLDLNQVVAEVLRLTAFDLQRRRVRPELRLSPVPLLVLGDRVHLEQVLLNLFLNAMDAMTGTPPPHRLAVRTAHATGGVVEVTIADTGHGIPPEQLPRLFESFFTTKKEGMGLGLSIARSLVEAHRGTLTAANNPDRGASFRITLPGRSAGQPS